jgi:fructose-bisphosphate aldolase, class II
MQAFQQEAHMALISMRQLLDHAAENSYGVAAFNVNNLEQIQSIMEAARETNSPVIIQASRGARSYTNDVFLRHLMFAAVELYPEIPVCVHQDHGNSLATCLSAIRNGFTSVMMDGSLMADGKTPASYDYNVEITREVVKCAHAMGISVEGELGCLGSLETGEGEKDPNEAARFVEETKVDALAIAIGTSHGAYKFTRKPDGNILNIERIKEIHKKCPNTHLVMHGSSSVPQDLQEEFRKYGGSMKTTWGVPVSEIQEGIRNGVRKINVDTDNRLAMTVAIRKVFNENPAEFDLRKYMAPARAAMQKIVAERMVQFGQAGQASKIKPVSLEVMAKRYL